MSEARQPYDASSNDQAETRRLTARVSALERAQISLQARIEELAEDMNTSFKQQTKYLEQVIEEKIAAAEGRILDAFKQLLTMLDARLPPKEDTER